MPSSKYKNKKGGAPLTRKQQREKELAMIQQSFEKHKQKILRGDFAPSPKLSLKPIDFSRDTLGEFLKEKPTLEKLFALYNTQVGTKKKVLFERLPATVTSCSRQEIDGELVSIKIGLFMPFPELMQLRKSWKDAGPAKKKGTITITDGDQEVFARAALEAGEFNTQSFRVVIEVPAIEELQSKNL